MRYTPDPTKDIAGFPILQKGDYRLKLGEPKTFVGETKEGDNKGKENFGIAFMCTVVKGPVDNEGHESPTESVGKKVFQRLFYHTEDAAGFRKAFQLAAYGYQNKEEEEFNAAVAKMMKEKGDDYFGFDTDSGVVGDGWKAMANKEIVASLSVKKDGDRENQKWDSVRPIPQPVAA